MVYSSRNLYIFKFSNKGQSWFENLIWLHQSCSLENIWLSNCNELWPSYRQSCRKYSDIPCRSFQVYTKGHKIPHISLQICWNTLTCNYKNILRGNLRAIQETKQLVSLKKCLGARIEQYSSHLEYDISYKIRCNYSIFRSSYHPLCDKKT